MDNFKWKTVFTRFIIVTLIFKSMGKTQMSIKRMTDLAHLKAMSANSSLQISQSRYLFAFFFLLLLLASVFCSKIETLSNRVGRICIAN